MKKLILLMFLLGCTCATAYGGTDYKCVSDCSTKGYMYNYCLSACSFDNPYPQPAPQYAPPPQQKLIGNVFPSAQDRINIDQQIRETQRLQEELNAARLRNQQKQIEIQQQQEEASKRQRILDLQLEEAEAKAAERRQKSMEPQEPEEKQ
jgi:hypothetical protein